MRTDLERSLARVEAAVDLKAAHIVRQRAILAGLRQFGNKALVEQADALLTTFEESLRLYIAERDRVRLDLAAAVNAEAPRPPSSSSITAAARA